MDGPWEIVSEMDNLAMIHYTPEADPEVYANLRGVVVDTTTGKIVSYSYPYAPTFVSNSLSTCASEVFNPDKVTDTLYFNQMCLSLAGTKISLGYEGPLYHIFLHNGKVYHSNRKRLDAEKSRWGNSSTFQDIYEKLGGPADSVLFDLSKKYSPYCYTFILNSPEVVVVSQNVSRNLTTSGQLVCLGYRKMYSIDNCVYPLDEIDNKPVNLENLHNLTFPQRVSVTEANTYLERGFYQMDNDENVELTIMTNFKRGEFVIIETEEGEMFRVESEAYHWRSLVRNNNPNYLHRFFEIYDMTLKNSQEYNTLFPDVSMYFKGFATSLGLEYPENIQAKDMRLYNAWTCFALAMPPHMSEEIKGYVNYLISNREKCKEWIVDLSDKFCKGLLDMSKYSYRVADILLKTKQFAENYVKKGPLDLKTGKPKNVDAVRRENCRNFINKEQGSSLYRLIREMNTILNNELESATSKN